MSISQPPDLTPEQRAAFAPALADLDAAQRHLYAAARAIEMVRDQNGVRPAIALAQLAGMVLNWHDFLKSEHYR